MVRKNISRAVNILTSGGVIAYPTEGVWGLGCDPFNERAVARVLMLKQRPVEKGLILVASSMEQIAPLLQNLDVKQRALLEDSWPGPHTWLLPDPDQLIPAWIKGKFDTVAVRVSDHPVVRALCRTFACPLVSTSANPGTLPAARNRVRVQTWFGNKLDFVVPGQLGRQKGPSTIRDLGTSRVVRV